MGVADDLEQSIHDVLNATWGTREGQVVPTTEDVTLKNGAVYLDAVYVYADLANSTELARNFPKKMVGKIVRSYLSSMSRIVRHHRGSIRSFDGDRVMGIFVGDTKESSAAICGLNMRYCLDEQLRPMIRAKYASLDEKAFQLDHCVGIASGKVMIVRAGVRGSNDLVSVGSAPNLAAKLSDMRTKSKTYMTHQVYNGLNKKAKYSIKTGEDMWTKTRVSMAGEKWECYKSTWRRKP